MARLLAMLAAIGIAFLLWQAPPRADPQFVGLRISTGMPPFALAAGYDRRQRAFVFDMTSGGGFAIRIAIGDGMSAEDRDGTAGFGVQDILRWR